MYSGDEQYGDDITSGVQEPEHLLNLDLPCGACGATWHTLADGSDQMDHEDGCTYIAALDRELEGRDEWYT